MDFNIPYFGTHLGSKLKRKNDFCLNSPEIPIRFSEHKLSADRSSLLIFRKPFFFTNGNLNVYNLSRQRFLHVPAEDGQKAYSPFLT